MLDHPLGAGSEGGFRLGFDARVRLEFHGSKISSDGGLLLFRELDETLGLHDMAGCLLQDTRTGKNGVHNFVGLLRQSTFGRLAGYPDVNDADRLSRDPVMRQIVGGRAVDGQAASTSQMAHDGIKGETVSIVNVFVARQPSIDRLSKKPVNPVNGVLATAVVIERTRRKIRQPEHIIQLAHHQKTAVRTDLGTMKFQPHPGVKTKPPITRFACTLWVIHNPPPSARLTR